VFGQSFWIDGGSIDLDGRVALAATYGDDLASDFAPQEVVIEKKSSLTALADDCEGHEKRA